jgi:protein-disulfide isomerase
VVAQFNDMGVTLDDVDATVGRQIYELRAGALKTTLMDELLHREAAARKITPEELYKIEVETGFSPPSTEELRQLYEENRTRGTIDPELDYPSFAERLIGSRHRFYEYQRKNALFNKLAKRAGLKVNHELLGYRPVAITSEGPSVGPANAPVQITEFADYSAQFAPLGNEALANMLTEFGSKLHVMFRTVPEDRPDSWRTSAAALCADEQGRFADYRERLLLRPIDATDEGLLRIATQLGLQVETFTQCLQSERKTALIQEQVADYKRGALTGQPSWVINGFAIGGAIPPEDFRNIISAILDGTYL